MFFVLKIIERKTLQEVKSHVLNNTCYDTEGEALTSYLNAIIDNMITTEQCFTILEVKGTCNNQQQQ